MTFEVTFQLKTTQNSKKLCIVRHVSAIAEPSVDVKERSVLLEVERVTRSRGNLAFRLRINNVLL